MAADYNRNKKRASNPLLTLNDRMKSIRPLFLRGARLGTLGVVPANADRRLGSPASFISRLEELRTLFCHFAARAVVNQVNLLFTEDLEAAGIAGRGVRQGNCGWVLGVFAFITLLKADPLRPKDPYAGNFGYRHETLSIQGEGLWLFFRRRYARSRRRTGRLPSLI